MAYEVITHGGGEGLVYAFNAIAALFNGKKALGSSIVYIASSFATVLMVMTMVAKQELLPTAKWFFGSLIISTALMVPKVDVIIKDRITTLERPVANVPFMLGVFASLSSQLGDILARHMDAIFSKAGPDYTGNGVAMASQLLAKVNHFHITDPVMAGNIRGFVQQCMVFDIAKGKYTIKELHRSDDVWKLLQENASKARGFVYKSIEVEKEKQGKNSVKSAIITCAEAATKLEAAWRGAYNQAALAYGSRLYPHAPKPASLFMKNLPLAHQYLTKLSHTAENILQQSMMSNAIDDGLLELNQLTDANAAVTAYAAKRAQAQQRVAYSLQGSMASLSLSVLKVVIEILFYSLFPTIVAISVFPGGYMVIKKYLIALFWIQSWAPMYAILNMIMNVYGKVKSTAAVTALGKGALSMYTLRGLGEANEWVSAAAGYAMMSVPFLSYGIIHYGAGALSQLATHFGSVTQSAASHAAEEATTGNYSMGNTNFDSHNRHNISGFKHDTNLSLATGRSTFQQADGSLLSRNLNGVPVYNRAGSLSEHGGNIKFSEQLANSFSESANESIQWGKHESSSAARNITAALNKLNEYRDNRSADKNASTSFTEQEQAFKETAISKYDDLVHDFAKDHHIDFSVAAELFGQVGMKIPGTDSRAGMKFSISGVDKHTRREAESYSKKHGMSELLKQSMSEAKEGRLNLSDAEGRNYGKAITASLSDAASHVDSAQVHFSRAQAYQKQATEVRSNALSLDQDLSNQYFNELAKEVGIEKAKTIVSNPDLNYQAMQKFSKGRVDQLTQQFKKTLPTNPSIMEQEFQKNKEEIKQSLDVEKHSSLAKEAVKVYSEAGGLDKPVSTEVKEKVEGALQQTAQEIEKQKQEINQKKEALMNKPEPKAKNNPVDLDIWN